MIGFYGSTATLPIETKSPPEAVATYTSCGRPDALYAGDAPAHRSGPNAAYRTGSNSAVFRPAPDRARENAAVAANIRYIAFPFRAFYTSQVRQTSAQYNLVFPIPGICINGGADTHVRALAGPFTTANT